MPAPADPDDILRLLFAGRNDLALYRLALKEWGKREDLAAASQPVALERQSAPGSRS